MKFYAADAHCDYLFGAMEYGWTIDTQKRNQTITLENLKKGGVALQFLAAWSDTTLKVPSLEQVLIMIDRYHTMLETHPELVPLYDEIYKKKNRVYWEALDAELRAYAAREGLFYVRDDDSMLRPFDAPPAIVNYFYHEEVKKSAKNCVKAER